MTRKQKKMLGRILFSGALMIALAFLPVEGWARFGLYMLAYLVIGWDILRDAGLGAVSGQLFDENFLMAIATLGAIALGIFKTGDYTEAVAVMLLYQVGELFQSYAVGKSRKSIAALMDIRPDYANLEKEGKTQRVDPRQVSPGQMIHIMPGEKVPLDGVVEEGNSTLDTSALTGESMPRDVGKGDEVLSGSVNISGLLRVRVTKAFGESTAAKILDMVENASSRKSRSEDFIARFARYYTPAVCLGAFGVAAVPPLARMLFLGLSPQWADWVYRALTFLIISCPCALVISVPLSFFAGIGGASRAGVLIKGSNYLEALSKVGTVVFDKTGTLTQGAFQVGEIRPRGMEKEKLLEYAALAQRASSHPISKSIRAACRREINPGRAEDIQEKGGKGVTARVDGLMVAVGNHRLMEEMGVEFEPYAGAGTVCYVAVDGKYAGLIELRDKLKPTACEAIFLLRKAGVKKIAILTGDREEAAREAARLVGADQVFGQLMPGDKVEKVEKLLKEKSPRETLAFVGDGVNDAPVLSRADVGVAMGAMGSDAAIEAADVVLMDDDPLKMAKAIRIARRCMAIVRENVVFAIGVKAVCLLLGAAGAAGMGLAIFADVGVMVLAVLNALRAMMVDRM